MCRQWVFVLVLSDVALATFLTTNPTPWYCSICSNPSINWSNYCCPKGGIWSSWTPVSKCTDTCGAFGTQTVERTCLSVQCGSCVGDNRMQVPCNRSPCKFPRNSCANGYRPVAQGKEIICENPNEIPETLPKLECCPIDGLMEWSAWTSCDLATCGSCTSRIRLQTCRTRAYGCGHCENPEQVITSTCITGPCGNISSPCCLPYSVKIVNGEALCI